MHIFISYAKADSREVDSTLADELKALSRYQCVVDNLPEMNE